MTEKEFMEMEVVYIPTWLGAGIMAALVVAGGAILLLGRGKDRTEAFTDLDRQAEERGIDISEVPDCDVTFKK